MAFFSASSLLMGYQGEVVLAAYALSRQLNLIAMQRACYAAVTLGAATGLCVAVVYVGFPTAFISIFVDVTLPENKEFLKLATIFLYIVAAMQLVDAIQGIVSNVLRGIRIPSCRCCWC